MAKKIEIIEGNDPKEGVLLRNGDLVRLHKNKLFLVASFATDTMETKEYSKFCTLINLGTGDKMFREPCSRATTRERILAHMNQHGGNFTTKDLEIIRCNKYSLKVYIDVDEEEKNE